MVRLLYLTSGHREAFPSRLIEAAREAAAVEPVDLYALEDTDLTPYAAVLVSMHADQRYLAGRAQQLADYLGAGGTVVANGHHAYPFLPGLSLFRPLATGTLAGLTIRRATEHPVWRGVDPAELTFRRGVAGFYGRGWHEPPHRATVVHTIGAVGGPVDVVYRIGQGRVLFHGGNDLWQFGAADDTTARILPQLLAWLAREDGAT